MNYNTLVDKVKDLFVKHLQEKLSDSDQPPSYAEIDSTYTNIQALGYNFGDVEAAAGDIYEIQSMMFGESERLRGEILDRVSLAKEEFPMEIEVFSQFHSESQAGMAFPEILDNISLRLK